MHSFGLWGTKQWKECVLFPSSLCEHRGEKVDVSLKMLVSQSTARLSHSTFCRTLPVCLLTERPSLAMLSNIKQLNSCPKPHFLLFPTPSGPFDSIYIGKGCVVLHIVLRFDPEPTDRRSCFPFTRAGKCLVSWGLLKSWYNYGRMFSKGLFVSTHRN